MAARLYEQNFAIEVDADLAELGAAFGIESGFQNRIVNVELPDPLPQLVYITGESGCGKSTLLRMIGGPTPVDIDPDLPLCKYHEDRDKALGVLSLLGLCDATLFLQPYTALSDSQQARARIAKMILDGRTELRIDEFLSTLDRSTARIVAYNFGRAVRKLGLKAVVVTAHTDLEMFLCPDLTVMGKAWPSRWMKQNPDWDRTRSPYAPFLDYKVGDKEWYREHCDLGELHYKGKYTGGIKDYRALFYKDELVGVLVATYRMHDGGRRIARLVIHPNYRGIGFGKYMVQKYLQEQPTADVVAAMARWNPVFERAGMVPAGVTKLKPPKGLEEGLRALTTFDFEQWHSRDACEKWCASEKNREFIARFASHATSLVAPGGKRLSAEEIAEKIRNEEHTAGRVLWRFRPQEMVKFKGVAHGN